jgi:hypothetical protein
VGLSSSDVFLAMGLVHLAIAKQLRNFEGSPHVELFTTNDKL